MTHTFRAALCLLSLSLFVPALAQSQAVSNSSPPSGASEVADGSVEEQERLASPRPR
jgi:hypothetical protein